MIIKVVCASGDSFSKLYEYEDGEYLIGVDGGVDSIIKNRLKVDLAIGDFDSTNIKDIEKRCRKVIKYDSEKNESDLELALIHITSSDFNVDYIAKKTIEEIIIYNATGNRLDHFYATINLLIRYTHLPIQIVDEKNTIYIVNSNTKFKKDKCKYISFFAVDDNTKITLKGFKYNLKNYLLTNHDNLCLSNEIEEPVAELETNNKKLLVIESN